MNYRDRFSGVLGPQSERQLATLFGLGELAGKWTGQEAAMGYLCRPGSTSPAFFTDNSGQVTLAADARLYNQAELVAKLRERGREIAQDAPAGELLLALYLEYGPDFARYARGMYSAAVWDGREQQLVLTRDAVGARPFYYTSTSTHLAFSSTLRSLRRWPELKLAINLDAVRKYLTYAFVPGEVTLLDGVYELLPGHYLLARPNRSGQLEIEKRVYWQLHEGEWDENAPVEAYSHPLRTLLEEAVSERLPNSGPVGVLLSGGLDSSAITALAARLYQNGPVHTYSISFGPEYPNELPFSSLVAEHCQTKHRILEISGKQIARYLEETVALLDDPVGDPLTTPNFLLDQAASADTDVILNGEGGDPCFGGPKNLPMLLHEMYGDGATGLLAREQNYLRSYQKCYEDLPNLLHPSIMAELATMPPQEELLAPFFDERSGMQHYLNKLMLMNVRLKGAHHILHKVDRMTAAHAIEGRSPLFDRRIVEFSFSVPPHWKLAGTNEKFVLKKAVEDILPASIIQRPKSGMMVPVQAWFRQPLKRLAKEHLLGKTARQRGIFNQELVKQWLDYQQSPFPRQGIKLWLVLTLEIWFKAYLDAPQNVPVLWRGQTSI
jgi:asparagine synthase (glutamine-hydrolysing)